MAKKCFFLTAFWLLESLIILASLVVVVCLYLPFVALKGAWQTCTGKARPRALIDPRPTQASGG